MSSAASSFEDSRRYWSAFTWNVCERERELQRMSLIECLVQSPLRQVVLRFGFAVAPGIPHKLLSRQRRNVLVNVRVPQDFFSHQKQDPAGCQFNWSLERFVFAQDFGRKRGNPQFPSIPVGKVRRPCPAVQLHFEF